MARHHHHLPASYLSVVIFVAFALVPLAAGQPLGQFCDTTGNYTANSTYQDNIRSIAATLPNSSASRATLFATAQCGTVPDAVYALALCRGDTNASACADCVAMAFVDAQQLCAYSKGVTIFYDPCQLRYSDKDLLAPSNESVQRMPKRNVSVSGRQYEAVVEFLDLSFDGRGDALLLENTQNVSVPFKVFDAAVGVLLNAIAEYAAANSSKRFATGVQRFQTFDPQNPEIYGLAQCTPDMAPPDCRTCLAAIIQVMPKYLSGKQGGRILGQRCNYRYEQYGFFSGGPLLQLPEPTVGEPGPAPVNVTTPAAKGGNITGRVSAIIMLPIVVVLTTTVVFCCYLWKRKGKPSVNTSVIDLTNPEGIQHIDSLIIDLPILRATTENFSEGKKLGQGGFGAVYKGVLPNGQDIAVKRLSQCSRQGMKELKTELVLVAKLQHKNLVRLVGVCLEEHEKLLVYEYMPNRSLDTFLFDPDRSNDLDWQRRFVIVNGVARGLQYLHEESQLKIVHRDLKASNVLLDSEFNPKISDFGLARLFGNDQSRDITNLVAGTYGYMAPEYAMRGHYSIKSDVFSFGVLVLEIVSGRRNGGSYDSEKYDHLLSSVWEHWTAGTLVEMMDSSLSSHSSVDQILKCIHIGLLCVQQNPVDRPMMSTVNLMLSSSSMPLQAPSRPAFCFQKRGTNSDACSVVYRGGGVLSENQVSITQLEGR